MMATQGTQTALEVAAPPTDVASKRALEGCFINPETDTEIVMKWEGDLAFTMTKNGRARDAVMIGANDLRWNGYKFRYERDETGTVERMWVDRDRIRNVRFEPSDQCS